MNYHHCHVIKCVFLIYLPPHTVPWIRNILFSNMCRGSKMVISLTYHPRSPVVERICLLMTWISYILSQGCFVYTNQNLNDDASIVMSNFNIPPPFLKMTWYPFVCHCANYGAIQPVKIISSSKGFEPLSNGLIDDYVRQSPIIIQHSRTKNPTSPLEFYLAITISPTCLHFQCFII